MYVSLKKLRGDGEHCMAPARAAAKETSVTYDQLGNECTLYR